MTSERAFVFEGREIVACDGQSLGGALLAAGVRTLSWSAKYRRPRGLRCCRGACPCCQVRVDGVPGVMACVTAVRGGERVERELPAAPHLPIGAAERFVRAGFYYPPWLARRGIWQRAEPLLATLAGVSRAPAPNAGRVGTFAERDVDVLIVGAGERGLLLAAEAARDGSSVLVVDRDWHAGGRLLETPGGAATAATLVTAATTAGAEMALVATALGGDSDGYWGVALDHGLLLVRPKRVEIAAGSWDRDLTLPDGDRPGVMTAGAVRRLLVREGVIPGRRAVLVTTGGADPGVADLLGAHGVRVAADCTPDEVGAISGRRAVTGIRVRATRVACDLVVIDAGRRPADELARQPHVLVHPTGSTGA